MYSSPKVFASSQKFKLRKSEMMRCVIVMSLCNCISSFHTIIGTQRSCHFSDKNRLDCESPKSLLFTRTYRRTRIPATNPRPIMNLFHTTLSSHTSLRQSIKSDLEVPFESDTDAEADRQTLIQTKEIAFQAAAKASAQTEIMEKRLTSKLLNASLLAMCFGFVTYSILNVDAGMTRGWSITEKAMRIPLDNWASYESSLNTQPVATKTLINVIIYLLGDWLSQTIFVKKNILEFDASRTLRNGLIGLVFGPIVHEYYEFSDYILPVEVGFNRVYKILMDQTLYLSIKCSIYIVAVNVLAGESLEFSVDTAKEKIKGVMFTAWKFWPLVHCITYGAIPARHRILWVNCVDLFWNAILALKTSGGDDSEDSGHDEVVDALNATNAFEGTEEKQVHSLIQGINSDDSGHDEVVDTLNAKNAFEETEEKEVHSLIQGINSDDSGNVEVVDTLNAKNAFEETEEKEVHSLIQGIDSDNSGNKEINDATEAFEVIEEEKLYSINDIEEGNFEGLRDRIYELSELSISQLDMGEETAFDNVASRFNETLTVQE